MKKLLALTLAAVTLLGSCGAAVEETKNDTTEVGIVTESPEIEDQTTPVPEDTEAKIETEAKPDDTEESIMRNDYKIKVSDDTYVYNTDGAVDYSTTNFGSDPDIQIKSNSNALTRYGYIKFDISSLVGDDDFTAIEVDLMLKSKQSQPGNPEFATVELYAVNPDGWSESTVTFAKRPEYVDLVSSRDDVKTPGTVYSFPITSYVRRALENGDTQIAFYIKDASGVPLHIKFESKDGGKKAPELSVYYGTKTDNKQYVGKMWGSKAPELSENGIDNIIGLRKSELFSVKVSEDTYVEAGSSINNNFGTASLIDVKAMDEKASAYPYNQYYRIALLKFELPTSDANAFDKAELELNCTLVEKSDMAVLLDVFGCDPDEWSESEVTFVTLPKMGERVNSVYVSEKGKLRIDVTDYVKKCVENKAEAVAFYLEGDMSTLRRLQFSSKESGLNGPKLIFNDSSTGGGFSTYLPYFGVNPWDNAIEMVSTWLTRWEEIKKGGDAGAEIITRDDSEYTLTVDATDNTSTNGADTVYQQYPTRTVSALKGFNASTAVAESELYDVYGGYMGGEKYEATGFFYTTKIGDRWWTIDPLGYPYFRVACVTISPGNTTQSAITLAKYSTYENWANATTARLKELGFNSAGGWSSIAYLGKVEEPLSQTYVMSVLRRYCQGIGLDVTTGGNTALLNDVMPVFDPAFVDSANTTIKSIVSPYVSASYVYGWMSDNELPQNINMLDKTLALDVSDERFLYSYATAWTFMYLKTGKRDVSIADVTDELRREYRAMVYDRYFEVIRDCLDRYVPCHQYMGCRFLKGCYSDEYVMRVAGYWCDVITYNYYNDWEANTQMVYEQQLWSGKPFVVTEFYAKGMDVWEKNNLMTNKSGAGWTVRTQNDRGLFYENFTLQLLECKGCVGFDWFLYRDNDPNDATADLSNRDSNKGIVDNNGEEYLELTKHMAEVNRVKYSLIEYFDER